MEHIAFLSKRLKLLDNILNGEKTIESRWYITKKAPFGRIGVGDVIYFKETGENVTAKARVSDLRFFYGLNPEKIKSIIWEFGSRIGVDVSYVDNVKYKKMCALIFLTDVRRVEPFNINKKGYGNMCAWISIDDVNKIKINGAAGI